MNNRPTLKSVLYALGFLTLTAMSLSAFAESTEYRRGYDAGYQDGLAARGQQTGSLQRMTIDRARYGNRGDSCDATAKLQRAADRARATYRQRSLTIEASDSLCGAPDTNENKRLDVRYHCGDRPSTRVSADEGDRLTLTCSGRG